MILYHGTNVEFDEIDLRKSKPNKDFGQGFYLSREYSQAMELAKIKVDHQPAHDYDIVIGPIANDRVGIQLWKYETKAIDLRTLVHNLRNMKGVTIQYFFGTERAIKLLKRL